MMTAYAVLSARSNRTRFSSERRFRRPVRLSVAAWSWVSATIRSSPMRAPARFASVARSWIAASSKAAPRLAGRVHDADGAAHDRHRDADRRTRARGSPAQLRARIERVAVVEALGLRAARGRAVVRRVDPAHRRFTRGRRHCHARQVRMAVVGEQQLDRRVGQGRCKGAFDDVDDLDLALGHLERVREPGLELLAPHLRGAPRGLAFGVVERRVELLLQAVHQRVRLVLLVGAGAVHHEDDRCQHHRHRGTGEQEAVRARCQLRADQRRRDREPGDQHHPEPRQEDLQALHALARGAVLVGPRRDALASDHHCPPRPVPDRSGPKRPHRADRPRVDPHGSSGAHRPLRGSLERLHAPRSCPGRPRYAASPTPPRSGGRRAGGAGSGPSPRRRPRAPGR